MVDFWTGDNNRKDEKFARRLAERGLRNPGEAAGDRDGLNRHSNNFEYGREILGVSRPTHYRLMHRPGVR